MIGDILEIPVPVSAAIRLGSAEDAIILGLIFKNTIGRSAKGSPYMRATAKQFNQTIPWASSKSILRGFHRLMKAGLISYTSQFDAVTNIRGESIIELLPAGLDMLLSSCEENVSFSISDELSPEMIESINRNRISLGQNVSSISLGQNVPSLGQNVHRKFPEIRSFAPKIKGKNEASLGQNVQTMCVVVDNEVKHIAKRSEATLSSKQSTAQNPVNEVELLYKAYPRKVEKANAIKAITKALKTTSFDVLMEAVQAYAETTTRLKEDSRRFVPHPATWFNGQRWEDDRSEWEKNTINPRKSHESIQASTPDYSSMPANPFMDFIK